MSSGNSLSFTELITQNFPSSSSHENETLTWYISKSFYWIRVTEMSKSESINKYIEYENI